MIIFRLIMLSFSRVLRTLKSLFSDSATCLNLFASVTVIVFKTFSPNSVAVCAYVQIEIC